MAILPSRRDRRIRESIETRLGLLDDDADIAENRQNAIDSKLNAILVFAIGSTASFASAAILLAVNLVWGG